MPRKNPLIVALFIFASSQALNAQSSGFGIKGGGQLSSTHEAGVKYDPLIGAVAGFYIPIWIGPRFEIQPELLASMQGSRYSNGIGSPHTFRSYYVQLPVSAKLYVSNVINFQAGGQIGKLIKGQHSYGDETTDITEDFQPIDAGFNVGIGADHLSGMDLTLRYYSGLTAVFEADQSKFPTNRTVQLTLGYRFKQLRGRRSR